RADERSDRPLGDGEAAAVDGGDAAEALRQAACLEQGHERRSDGTIPRGSRSRMTTKTSEYAIRYSRVAPKSVSAHCWAGTSTSAFSSSSRTASSWSPSLLPRTYQVTSIPSARIASMAK